MRCTTLTAFLAAAVLVGAGCADSPEAPSAPPDPVLPDLAVVSATTIRTQINELLVDPARTAALFQLRRVQEDIQYRRKTLYLNALALAVIPLHERERHRIPPEKLEKLFRLLCNLSDLIRPHLPPWLAAIDFCLINPGQLATDAKVQVVTNAFGGTVTTERQTFSFDIEPNSMFDAAGNPVPAVLVVVLPLLRQQPTEGEQHPCPAPWDDESFPQSTVDCYEEFYDLSVRPLVRFSPAADLEVCQLDPASENPNAPTSGVFARLELFTKDAANQVRILANPDSPSDADAVCTEDNIEHAIGPIDWSRWGMRNALLRLGRAGSHALSLFRPTVLYANNRPTHGDIVDELLFGNVVGAIDRGLPAPASSSLYGVNSNDDGLSTVDPATGAVSFVARLHPDPNTYVTPIAMATDPATGTIYAWNNSNIDPETGGTVSTGVLLTVDRCTGSGTPVNAATPPQGNLAALALSPTTGILYGIRSELYAIDKTSGVRVLIGSLGEGLATFGADFDASGVLYALNAGGTQLYTVNLTTGAATLVANLSTSVGTVGSIVFTPSGTLVGSSFGDAGNILYDIDKATGAVSNTRTVTGGSPPQGMGFAPACDATPEP